MSGARTVLLQWLLLAGLLGCQADTHYHIDNPEVRQHVTPFTNIAFQEGDLVYVNASGCVQTGGSGNTWKRYVDPQGDNAERLYHGLIWIPGATAGLETLGSVMARSPVVVPRMPAGADLGQMYLRLGYDDDNYSDNGYWGHDDGQYGQCRSDFGAQVDITIIHQDPPTAPPPCPPLPIDLYWKDLDVNMLPLNPRWGAQCNQGPEHPLDPVDPGPACNHFRTNSRHNLNLGDGCTRSLPTVDSKDAPFWCHSDDHGVNGHVNFGVGSFTGHVYWDDWSSCIDPNDCDINIHLIPPHYEASCIGNAREGGEPTVQLEFDARETVARVPPGVLPWWRQFTTQDNAYRGDAIRNKSAIVMGVINFDNVHQIITEVHPVLGMALHISSTPTEDFWVIMARRSGNQGGCSSDALQHLHDPELGELRFMLNPSQVSNPAVGSSTQFKKATESLVSDTEYSVNFGPGGILLRIPLPREGVVVFGELHVTESSWSNEEDLGGVLSSAPAAASWGFNRIDVFYRGQNNHLWHRSWDGAQWNNEEDLGGLLNSDPVAASWGFNRIDVFYRGQNNHLWHRSWDGAQWNNEEDLGGLLNSDPVAVSWGFNRIDVFYRGQNNHLWHRSWDGAQWNNEEDLGGVLSSAPAAASWGLNRIDIFYRGQNNHLWHRSWDGAQWNNEEDLGGVLSSAPAAASWGFNRIDVFYCGQNNHLWHRSWDSAQWNNEEDLGGVLSSAPAAASWGLNRIDVFYRGQNNHLWHRSWMQIRL